MACGSNVTFIPHLVTALLIRPPHTHPIKQPDAPSISARGPGDRIRQVAFINVVGSLDTSGSRIWRLQHDRTPRTQPALYSVSIAGPFNPTGIGETPSRKRIFTCRPANSSNEEACAKTILSTLARRAYRRPATTAEVQMLVDFYKQGRADGSFEHGVEMALRAMLTSPAFLFRSSRNPGASAEGGTLPKPRPTSVVSGSAGPRAGPEVTGQRF